VIEEIDATTLYQHQWSEYAPAVKTSGIIKLRQFAVACSGPIHLQRSCSPQVGLSYANFKHFTHFTLEAVQLVKIGQDALVASCST